MLLSRPVGARESERVMEQDEFHQDFVFAHAFEVSVVQCVFFFALQNLDNQLEMLTQVVLLSRLLEDLGFGGVPGVVGLERRDNAEELDLKVRGLEGRAPIRLGKELAL